MSSRARFDLAKEELEACLSLQIGRIDDQCTFYPAWITRKYFLVAPQKLLVITQWTVGTEWIPVVSKTHKVHWSRLDCHETSIFHQTCVDVLSYDEGVNVTLATNAEGAGPVSVHISALRLYRDVERRDGTFRRISPMWALSF